jgi:hypothetical protein
MKQQGQKMDSSNCEVISIKVEFIKVHAPVHEIDATKPSISQHYA